MKKILTILVTCVLVLSGLGAVAINVDNTNNIHTKGITRIMKIDFSSPRLVDSDDNYVRLCLGDEEELYLMNPGQPMLPRVLKTIELPFGVKNVKVEVMQKAIHKVRIIIVGKKLMNYDDSNLVNRLVQGSLLKIADVDIRYDGSLPFFDGYKNVGQSAYVWYGSGIPLDFSLNKRHPIFKGYPRKTRNIKWVAGPAFEKTGKDVTVLSYFPNKEISSSSRESKDTRVHAWRWPGTSPGWPPNFLELIKEFLNDPKIENLWNILMKLTDWDKTNKIVKTNLRGKAAAIATTYERGRVFAISPHPELSTWDKGHVVEKPDIPDNCLGDKLYYWDGKKMPDDFNFWIVRRAAAWVAKVPNSDLPPISKKYLQI